MNNLKIFGVDDDLFYLEIFKHQLHILGYDNVTVFDNPEHCISHLNEMPDVVFLDYQMGNISGFDSLKKIKEIDPSIFVVMLSGQEQINTAVETLKGGAFDYLQKSDDDLSKIENVLIKIMEAKSNAVIELKKQNAMLENLVQQRTEEIRVQKLIIEEKNKDITDSIHYALRIQNAIIKSKEKFKNFLPESFLFFKPKDIVSGDFSYFSAFAIDGQIINNNTTKPAYIVVGAIDCTGHGVPGALMSVIGFNGLNYATSKSFNPGAILDTLSDFVENLFYSDHTDQIKDGMDMSICVIDLNNKKISYAGAHNPIFVIRKTNQNLLVNNSVDVEPKIESALGYKLFELKADSRPVGNTEQNHKFSTQTFSFNSMDRVYLFTDGITDQFGGEFGKKYSKKRLKNFLIEHQNYSIQQQGNLIKNEFENYKGQLEQLDDVCIIGIET